MSIAAAATTVPTTATTNTATTNTSSANSGTSLASDFTNFITLLTTQLKAQDPTNPVDSNQFTQQLVEFAGVQQQVNANTTLASILSTLQGSQIGSASSYIGTTIQASGNGTSLASGTSYMGYTLPSGATSATVTISDSNGNVVYSGKGSTTQGSNIVQWDGSNNITGATEPDGNYTFSVKATDANGNAVTATPFITGTVTSAELSNGSVVLDIGSLQVPVTSVTNVANITKTTGTTS